MGPRGMMTIPPTTAPEAAGMMPNYYTTVYCPREREGGVGYDMNHASPTLQTEFTEAKMYVCCLFETACMVCSLPSRLQAVAYLRTAVV
jgi:hypothetical protein